MPIHKKLFTDTVLPRAFALAVFLIFSARASAQFVSYFDYVGSTNTHTNATVMPTLINGVGFSIALRNIANGSNTPVTVTVTNLNALPGGPTPAGAPAPGTPTAQTFNGFVDFESFNIELQTVSPSPVLAHVFTGLDPQKSYNFRGTAIRGDAAYTDRWTRFTLAEADSFTNAHTANALTSAQVPADLQTNDVAINSGVNNTATTGDLAGWNNIKPGADGRIVIYSRKYNGAVPGGSSAGSKAYGLAGFRLEEISVLTNGVAPRIVAQPAVTNFVCRENPVTLTLNVTGSPPPSFQWFLDGTAIPGATSSNFVIARAQPSDRGIYTATASNAFGSTNSASSALGVSTLDCFDGSAPVLTLRRALPMSINGAGATSGPPVTASCGSFGRLTRWFRLVSQTNGLATVSTEGSTYDTRLGVFSTPLTATPTNIACSDDWSSSNQFSRVQFLAQTGAVYFVAVEGPSYQQNLRLTCAIEPLLFTPLRTNGLIQIRSEVAPALSYRLQASSNSLTWSTIFSTNLSVTGAVVYRDAAFTNQPQRLYKLVPGP
jgi:Immunoglobulin domain